MSVRAGLVQLHDLDLLIEEAGARGRGGAAGTALAALTRARTQLHARLEPRWVHAYDRAQQRYGRALVAVRGRVCQGCFITLPTSAAASRGSLGVCESCGRILIWR